MRVRLPFGMPTLFAHGLIVGALIFRLVMAWSLGSSGVVGSLDYGAYVLSLHCEQTGGAECFGDYRRPPLAPGWLLWPFAAAFGEVMGVALWAALLPTLFQYALWLFLRRFVSAHVAGITAGLAAVEPISMHVARVGALPFLAFAVTLTAAWGVAAYCETRRRVYLLAVALVGIVPLMNMPAAAVSAPFLMFVWYLRPSRHAAAVGTGAALATAVVWLPFYLPVVPWLSSAYSTAGITTTPPVYVLWLWIPPLFILALCGLVLRTDVWGRVIGGAALANAVALQFMPGSEAAANIVFRAPLLVLPLAISVGVELFEHKARGIHKRLLIGVMVALSVQFGMAQGQVEQSFYQAVDDAIPVDAAVGTLQSRNIGLIIAADRRQPVVELHYPFGVPRAARDDLEGTLCLMGWTGAAAPEDCVAGLPLWWVVDTEPRGSSPWHALDNWPDTLGYESAEGLPDWWKPVGEWRNYAFYHVEGENEEG